MTSAVLVFKDKSQQTDGSGPALFNLFNKRVKENLHIIFAMSPLSPEFGSFIASEWLLPKAADAIEVKDNQVGTPRDGLNVV